MRELLEFFLKNFDHLYGNPECHITNSKTTGTNAVNASITVTGAEVSWLIANDRGQMQLSITPTRLLSPENCFWISLIRQYLDG